MLAGKPVSSYGDPAVRFAPAGQCSDNREDDRAVRIADVPLGALQVGS